MKCDNAWAKPPPNSPSARAMPLSRISRSLTVSWCASGIELAPDLLERMAEHTVANIVDQSGRQRDLRPVRMVLVPQVPLDHLHQQASHGQHADAVREARVRGSGHAVQPHSMADDLRGEAVAVVRVGPGGVIPQSHSSPTPARQPRVTL